MGPSYGSLTFFWGGSREILGVVRCISLSLSLSLSLSDLRYKHTYIYIYIYIDRVWERLVCGNHLTKTMACGRRLGRCAEGLARSAECTWRGLGGIAVGVAPKTRVPFWYPLNIRCRNLICNQKRPITWGITQ